MIQKGRKVLLLVEKCSSHGRLEFLSNYSNVELLYLLLTSTFSIQPYDASIIATLKVHYRKFQMERAIYFCEEDVNDVYKRDVLTAMMKF